MTVIKGRHVRILNGADETVAPEDGGPRATQPSAEAPAAVELRRTGDLVTSIEVRCGCGRVLVLDCQYDPPATAGQE